MVAARRSLTLGLVVPSRINPLTTRTLPLDRNVLLPYSFHVLSTRLTLPRDESDVCSSFLISGTVTAPLSSPLRSSSGTLGSSGRLLGLRDAARSTFSDELGFFPERVYFYGDRVTRRSDSIHGIIETSAGNRLRRKYESEHSVLIWDIPPHFIFQVPTLQ